MSKDGQLVQSSLSSSSSVQSSTGNQQNSSTPQSTTSSQPQPQPQPQPPPSQQQQQSIYQPKANIKESLSVLSEFLKTVQLHQHSIVRGVTDEMVETKSSMKIDFLDVSTSKNVITIETKVKTVAKIEALPVKKKILR